jgi:hypothetical protein
VRRAGWLALLLAAPAWASHPLISEDTDVLDKREWELELHGERVRDEEGGVRTRRTDVVPYLREVTYGDVASGRGDGNVAVKWRFYEKDRLSLVFKPDLLLPTGRDEAGLGAERTRWAANLVGGYETGKLEVLAHVGYTDNRNRIGAAARSGTHPQRRCTRSPRSSASSPTTGATSSRTPRSGREERAERHRRRPVPKDGH